MKKLVVAKAAREDLQDIAAYTEQRWGTAQRRLADGAQLEILRHRVDQLELRLAALERRQPSDPPT